MGYGGSRGLRVADSIVPNAPGRVLVVADVARTERLQDAHAAAPCVLLLPLLACMTC